MKTAVLTLLATLIWCDTAALAGPREEFIERNKKSHDEIVATLSAMHKALIDFMGDNEGIWPQFDYREDTKASEMFEFWIETLNKYGVRKEQWFHSGGEDISYMPAMFDDTPLSAFNWSTQPWIITRGISSGETYSLLPDGRIFIHTFDNHLIPKADDPNREPVKPAPIPKQLENFRKGLHHNPAEKDGADQPATAPESKPEDNSKPQSEPEARPR